MTKIKFDYSKAEKFIAESEINALKPYIEVAHNTLHKGTGAGSDFLGWVNLPENYDKEEFARIKKAAEKIKKSCDIFVVIGIGGSYLGARAAIEFLTSPLANYTAKTQIFYVGNSISGPYLAELIDMVKDKELSVNVISKSGTTTEPAIAFRVFK